MSKRSYREIRKKILQVLSDGKEHRYGSLEREVNTNWTTVRTHCKDLEIFGAVTIKDSMVKITKQGLEALRKL